MTAFCTCGADSDVLDSRRDRHGVIRRRRRCVKCGTRWSTIEVLQGVTQPISQAIVRRIEGGMEMIKTGLTALKEPAQ